MVIWQFRETCFDGLVARPIKQFGNASVMYMFKKEETARSSFSFFASEGSAGTQAPSWSRPGPPPGQQLGAGLLGESQPIAVSGHVDRITLH